MISTSAFCLSWVALGVIALSLATCLDKSYRRMFATSGPFEALIGGAILVVLWPILPMVALLEGFDWCTRRLFKWSYMD